jgi:glycine/D-amino acid oxidase-like deaminating enzyme
MTTYDWIIIGNGITGASLSYELAKIGASVLVLERSPHPDSATRYSYGGVAFWAGTTKLSRTLCSEGIARHRQLTDELGAPTEFCERDLLMPVFPDDDLDELKATCDRFDPVPQWIDCQTAGELEPRLNLDAIASAFVVKHGHVHPMKITHAYNHGFQQLGGILEFTTVTDILQTETGVSGVQTDQATYHGKRVVVCAGGLSRQLLHRFGLSVRCYFSHAELIETPPIAWRLNTVLMPANTKRFALEAEAGNPATEARWNEAGHEITDPIFDAGVFQFADGHLRLGQISRLLTDPNAPVDEATSERTMRDTLTHLVPDLADVGGTWRRCLVAFSGDRLPLVGEFNACPGLYIFSGFSNPFAFIPAIAQRFAASQASSQSDAILTQFNPDRFSN